MSVSKRLRYEILRRDNHACRYCGAAAPQAVLTVDHVVPTALGGSDDPSNLVAACDDCNFGKSSSNPDATLVAEVEGDALRWARAQHLAAQKMLEDLERRDHARAEFKARWDTWHGRGGAPVPLPGQWGVSVDQFLAAGLPMPILLDCVDKTMSNSRIKVHDLFRYMCGIAWKRVGELRTATAAEVSTRPLPPPAPLIPSSGEVVSMLTGALNALDVLADQDGRDFLAECFDVAFVDDEGGVAAYATWSDDLKATVYLIYLELGHVDISGVASELVEEQLAGDLELRVAEVTAQGSLRMSRSTMMNRAILAAIQGRRAVTSDPQDGA